MRKDVLVYISSDLKEDLEVIVYTNATIYASTSATDTDFFVKLIDVTLEGIAYNVTQGGRRGRYLKNGRASPTALILGTIEKYDILNFMQLDMCLKRGIKFVLKYAVLIL